MNILIVDDEEFVLDYIEEVIASSHLSVQSILRANSAMEALELIGCNRIDIIISDIRMPEMSGIELLDAIRAQYPDTKVILLSGYSEFEYALKAIKRGAFDYLLKPVTGEEVLDCLKKALEAFHQENRAQQSLSQANALLEQHKFRLREQLLTDLLLGKRLLPAQFRQEMETLGLDLSPDHRCVLAIIRLEPGVQEMSYEDFELLSFGILNMAEEILSGQVTKSPFLWTCKDSNRYLIAIIPAEFAETPGHILQNMKALKSAAKVYLKRTLSILISTPFVLQADLSEIYSQAAEVITRSIDTADGIVLSMDAPSSEKERNHVIRQVQAFIDQHIKDDVSLQAISEHVYLHPVHVSRLYKKVTGESLSLYITKIRMEKAAMLLKSTNMKVSDIAEEVGLRKTQYFIRLFKQYYRMTPQSFRNQ